MQPKYFTLERLMRANASSRAADDRTILRLDRDALKAAEPKIRFAQAN
jgi:hypothetical protein